MFCAEALIRAKLGLGLDRAKARVRVILRVRVRARLLLCLLANWQYEANGAMKTRHLDLSP